MQIFYRISDGSYPKVKFEGATKEGCFNNFCLNCYEDKEDVLNVFLDGVEDETWNRWKKKIEDMPILPGAIINLVRSYGGSSAGGFRVVFDEALKLDDTEYVYFVEDDYIHLPGSRRVLLEGLERANYVTLYNHPDKYIPASKGGNPLIADDGAEATKVFVTASSYWMLTNSTTMTFATQVKTLREDLDVWERHTSGTYPLDMQIFLNLRNKGRSLIQPIPTKSTHALPDWAAHLYGTPYDSWEEVLHESSS